jgi:hypothetical protein
MLSRRQLQALVDGSREALRIMDGSDIQVEYTEKRSAHPLLPVQTRSSELL